MKFRVFNWLKQLENSDKNEDMSIILKEIFQEFQQSLEDPITSDILAYIENLTNLDCDNIFLENINKTYFRILYKLNKNDINIYSKFILLENYKKYFFINGIFLSEYFKIINECDFFLICYTFLRDTSIIYTKICTGALKCMVCFCKNFTKFLLPSNELWKYIYFNLDAPFNGAREQSILLLENVISKDFNFTIQLFDELINFWSWTNKFKYYILAIIFSNYGFHKILNIYKNIDATNFLVGSTISLKYTHLMPASQALVKVLVKQDIFELNQIIANIIKSESDYEFKNCIKYWMINMKDKWEIYNNLELKSNRFNAIITNYDYLNKNDYFRLFCLRNVLKECFENHEDVEEIDEHLLKQINSINPSAKGYLFELILTKIIKYNSTTFEKNLNYLKSILTITSETDCSTLRQTIFKKISILFDSLSKIYFSRTIMPGTQEAIFQFYEFLKNEIYSVGITQFGNYQKLIFSLTLYEILIKTFPIFQNHRLHKATNLNLNQKFRLVLTENKIWDLYSKQQCMEMYELLGNEFDNIREISQNILIVNFNENKFNINYKENSFKLIALTDTTKCSYGELHCRLYVACSDLNEQKIFLSELIEQLKRNYTSFLNDSLTTVKNGNHLFGIVNCIAEIIKYHQENQNRSEYVVEELVRLIMNLSDSMLDLLNLAGKNKVEPPDFEVMDQSLQLLIENSEWCSTDNGGDRKILLNSIWYTLKSCADIATVLGIYLLKSKHFDNENNILIDQIKICLEINYVNLYKCRHKGVIEAAGLSLGKFVNYISSNFNEKHKVYILLYDCFPILFGYVENTTTTRRGAGFSIMLHHLIKNDMNCNHPLLTHALRLLLGETKIYRDGCEVPQKDQFDSLEASVLHYLCVLVKDSNLGAEIMPYMERIIILNLEKINSQEWKIRNAALQLFGAIIPKLLGQRQYFDEDDVSWDPIYITIDEIITKMPELNTFILKNLKLNIENASFNSTSSIILFLEFLSKIEVRKLVFNNSEINLKYNQYFWSLLRHNCEKVRILASKCLALFHEFRLGIPKALDNILSIIFCVTNNENFIHGLISTVNFMLRKYECDIRSIEFNNSIDLYFKRIRGLIRDNYKFPLTPISFYLRYNFLKLFQYLDFNCKENFLCEFLFMDKNLTLNVINEEFWKNYGTNYGICLGYDIWKEHVNVFFKLNF